MNATFTAGDRVKHAKFGIGEVLLDRGATVVVTFEHGLEQCPPALLQRLDSFANALARPDLDPPAEVIARALGDAVRSVNDAWGVFSRSRIALLLRHPAPRQRLRLPRPAQAAPPRREAPERRGGSEPPGHRVDALGLGRDVPRGREPHTGRWPGRGTANTRGTCSRS